MLMASILVLHVCIKSQEIKDSIVIPFNLEGHYILLDVKINDCPETFKFTFDTGGKITINPKHFEKMHITPYKSIQAKWLGWAIQDFKLDSMCIGSLKKENLKLSSIESDSRDYYLGLDGLIGPDFFKGYRYTVDYKNGLLTLTDESRPLILDSNSIPVKYSVWTLRGTMDINLTIADSIKIKAALDTGCPVALILPRKYVNILKEVVSAKIIKSRGNILQSAFGKAEESYLSRIPELEIGHHKFTNVPVYFYGDLACIGMDFLSPFRATFDRKNSQIILQPIEGEDMETNVKSYGLHTSDKDSNGIFVDGLWEGSPADIAGINPGDQIMEVNGKDVMTCTEQEINDAFRDKQTDEIELLIRGEEGDRRLTLKKAFLLPEAK